MDWLLEQKIQPSFLNEPPDLNQPILEIYSTAIVISIIIILLWKGKPLFQCCLLIPPVVKGFPNHTMFRALI